MQQLLFRDWRFALLWAIGLTAGVAAFFAEGGGHEDLARSAAEIKAARQVTDGSASAPVAAPAQASAPVAEEDEGLSFGEPLADTTPLDPTPPDEAANAGSPDAATQ
jgi:hypothetical protein